MERILSYLAGIEPNCTGEAWVLITRVMEDLDLTREEVYPHIMKADDEGLVKIIKTLEPGPYGSALSHHHRMRPYIEMK